MTDGASMISYGKSATRARAAKPGNDLYIQALRGLAIAAVVFIHCLPELAASVVVRPWLNFAVALFVFLSGYLTPGDRVGNAHAFWGRRLGKILAPYMFWSLFYLAARGELAPTTVLSAILTGGGSAQMYYLLVYAQLVLLTPALYQLLDFAWARAALYALTPAISLARIGLAFAGQDSVGAMIGVFCGSWLVYYLLGLEWRERVEPALISAGVTFGRSAFVLAVCLALQIACGMLWFSVGNYAMAVGQLKATTMFTSITFIITTMFVPVWLRRALSTTRPLISLGNLSFGIYLCHMAPVMVLGKVSAACGFKGMSIAIIIWLVSLAVSTAAVALCQRILSKRTLSVIGFS